MRFGILILVIFISCPPVYAQNNELSEEFKFINYLIKNYLYNDALFLLNKLEKNSDSLNISQKDSINYLKGWVYYNVKSLDTSALYLDKVSINSVYYNKSQFYRAFNNIYTGKRDYAKDVLNNLSTENELYQLKNFELAGIALLDRNYEEYSRRCSSFTFTYYPIAVEQESFNQYYKDLRKVKHKSALTAGLMSAIVPGSGKLYAGYKWKALSSFLQVVITGLVASENYYKAGPASPQFIFFAGIFSIMYTGNIWGSILSVKIKKNETHKTVDNNILYDLHLPLRRTFN